MNIEKLTQEALELLKNLIKTQSFSSEEEGTATFIENSHHDTVQPNNGYTRDPYSPDIEDGKLYGLGSNDAGGCLVSLIATFTYFYAYENPKYNLVLVASGEEESSGPNGLNSMLKVIPHIDVAIVGEPTLMTTMRSTIV